MTVSLPIVKVEKIIALCTRLLTQSTVLLREVAQVIGLIVSSFIAIQDVQLHYRELKFFKREHLQSDEDYEKSVSLSDSVKKELQWWVDNVQTANGRPFASILSLEDFKQDLYSDASKKVWGCALALHGKIIQRCSGQWSVNEAKEHINYLELQATLFGLRCFGDLLSQNVRFHCDNNTIPVAYVNKFGGCHKKQLNELGKEFWLWCIDKNVSTMLFRIAGVENAIADSLSRDFNTSVGWSLNDSVFDKLCSTVESVFFVQNFV